MKKCIITGHTQGIGKTLYDYFQSEKWEVIGLSRSNGYKIPENIDKIIELSKDCDLFINNSYADGHQLELLNCLHEQVANMIVIGSIARFEPFDEILPEYSLNKKKLADRCRLLSIKSKINILLLDLSFIEEEFQESDDIDNFYSDFIITHDEIISSIKFWLKNPKIRQMEFVWKLTPKLYLNLFNIKKSNKLKKIYNEN